MPVYLRRFYYRELSDVKKEEQKQKIEFAVQNSNIVEEEVRGTNAIIESKKQLNDVERELLAFKVEQMDLGLTTEKENAEIRRQLIQQEIKDIKELLRTQSGYVVDRETMLTKLNELEKKLDEAIKYSGPVLVEVNVHSVGEMPRYFAPPPHATKG